MNSFLVEGTERALLIDTGMGIGDMRGQVELLTTKPITAVNTHYHFDHTSGNASFDDVCIHSSGVDQVQTPERRELYEVYLDFSKRMLGAYQTYKHHDERFFHLLAEHADLRPLPEDLHVDTWRRGRIGAVSPVDDGVVLDLGGRRVTVIHTPGHSFDSICLHDDRTGSLFTGDTINTGPVYTQFSESNLVDYAASTARLAGLASDVSTVYAAHFVKYAAPPDLLHEHAKGFRQLLEGTAPFIETSDIFGMPAMQAHYDGFSIMASAEDLAEAQRR